MSAPLRHFVGFKSFRFNYRPSIPHQKTFVRKWTTYYIPIQKQSLIYVSTGSPLLRPLFRSGVTCSSTASRRSSSSNSNSNSNSASASANGNGNGNANANANANTTNSSTPLNHSRWRRLWRPFIWLQFTFGLGFLAIVLKNYKRQKTHPSQSPELIVKDWEILYFRVIPFRALSRAWGWLTNCQLPTWARQPIIGLYARTFNCNLDEALDSNLENYPCLAEFFRRKLKEHVRPIDKSSCVVSPSDGTVLNFGRVTAGMMEQVKGVSYSLNEFLGPAYWKNGVEVQSEPVEFEKSLLLKKDTDLYHCVIYLAPGDYHCFHSPVEWTVNFRRHFPGELFSVNPSVAKWVAGLFSLNERAVYVGEWEHGFFSMTPVGATNVGSIRIYDDEDLVTNCTKRNLPLSYYDRYMEPGSQSIPLKKGQIFGEFNLGSTIVLIFEAPKDFQFNINPGDTIRMGQGLNCTAPSD